MGTLWSKGTSATQIVEDFTVGNDRVLDLRLAKHDVMGSKAHIKMLESIGLLEKEELETLTAGLDAILGEIERGEFVLGDDVEDIHSQVEFLLTQRFGEIGKKIHSGRSRNDQVLVDLKLFLREELEIIKDEVVALFDTLQALSEKHKNVLLPGYTHAQIAMPSSFGLWFGAYAEALVDDMHMLKGAYNVVNQNPLGSAAGYGSSFPLDRDMTTELLGFSTMNYNVVAAQLSRGKSEKAVASALSQLALTLNKFAADCCMYMCPNFGFIKFPDELTTGSSIMPHKKNPDVWEILRGICNRIQSLPNEISLMTTNMAHGYHRDYQLLKDVLFPGLEQMHKCLFMAKYMLENISVNEDILSDPKYKYLFTVEVVNNRVLEGMPFRDAYKSVGIEVNEGKFEFDANTGLNHTHKGSLGNLCTEEIKEKMKRLTKKSI
ncbi:MAG: argininosuccinate lyase [Bacteroidales bacterium]|nr:argininosuccinate lyase [Bacteroidales bacterium]